MNLRSQLRLHLFWLMSYMVSLQKTALNYTDLSYGPVNDDRINTKSKIDCVDVRRIEDNFFSPKKEYNNGPDANQVNARRVLNQVKENDRTFQLSTQQIVAWNVIGINQSTASALPALSSMTGLAQQTRRDANTPRCSPNSLSSIALPIENTLSRRDEKFLQYYSGQNENRILIFSTNNNLEPLRSSNCWYCYVTF
ncbi:hypothetical protein RF11_08068 [Thelohanellus kitauei]|uniref:Uncharacterized protein n=1 Tax=Thelohanellus kitauei TaxID=669202 RepID=A0A0C2MIW5_THEKT|nr:hypothetical protein RF11_08068 [Thelohanellus kitauei]